MPLSNYTATPGSIVATYEVETAFPMETAVALMAGEQSAGTFVRVAGETPELLARHGAQVIRIEELDAPARPSLPHAKRPTSEAPYRRARVTVRFPLENIGTALPNLFTMVAGNLFELDRFSGLRLLDLDLPAAFTDAQPGPQFGIAGTRRLVGVHDRPILGTIIKPSTMPEVKRPSP